MLGAEMIADCPVLYAILLLAVLAILILEYRIIMGRVSGYSILRALAVTLLVLVWCCGRNFRPRLAVSPFGDLHVTRLYT